MSDLLKNGGFEKEWTGSHRVLVIEGVRYYADVGNVFTPPDWITWYDHRGDYAQPEVTEMHASQYPERARSGAKSMRFFTFSRRHDGGFFQFVDVEPGARVRLSAYAHAWSNHDIEGYESCFEDGMCSAGVGRGGHALDEAPPLNGDPWNDAIGNFTFRLGIDPRGGDDPTSREIVWGPGSHIYNEFAPVPPVETAAAGDRVTVFLRSTTLWPFKHNDAYWDDAMLEVVEEPPPDECRGHPRVQYARVYNVIPQGASDERAAEIFLTGWRKARQTAGGSYDDAGVGDLDGRKAVLWDIDEEDRQSYLDFYAEHYEDVEVEFAGGGADPWAKYRPFLLWQAKPEWADHVYAGGECYTLASQGCFITINASAQRWYGIDPDATPVTVDLTVGPEGYDRCLLLHSAMREKLGLDIEAAHSKAAVMAHLAGGDVVFIEVQPSSMMHFVCAVEWDGTDFVVLDPLKGKIGHLKDLYAGAESYRLISEYKTEPQYPEPSQILGFQQQRTGAWRDEFIAAVRPDYWKLIGGMGEAEHLLSIHPGLKVIYRHFENDWGKFVLADDKDKAARRFVAMFRDSLEQHADAIYGIEELNEYIATNDYATLEHVSGWVEAFCAELDRIGMPAVPVTFNTAVGNPQTDAICREQQIPSQVAYLVGGVRATVAAGGLVGYHAYHGARATADGYYCTLDGDERRYYSMRALLEWDQHFRAEGVYPRYLFTEGGTIYVAPWGGMPSAYAGWRDRDCFGGDMDWRTEQAVRRHVQFGEMVAEWNAGHGNRARGMTTFLWGGNSEWVDFEWEGGPGQALAEALGEEGGA